MRKLKQWKKIINGEIVQWIRFSEEGSEICAAISEVTLMEISDGYKEILYACVVFNITNDGISFEGISDETEKDKLSGKIKMPFWDKFMEDDLDVAKLKVDICLSKRGYCFDNF